MKKIYFLALFITSVINAQIVNIPDANFKNKLVTGNCVDTNQDYVGDAKVDLNSDGEIQITEAEAVSNLFLGNSGIADLTGIDAFINIERLICDHNSLTSLDVSNLTQLKELSVPFNPITSINTTGLSEFWLLECSNTPVTDLDFSTNPNFAGLVANFCTALTSLNASGTAGPTVDLFGTTNIQHLNLHGCVNTNGDALNSYLSHMGNLQTLDLAGVQGITMLAFGGTSLDITGCTSLEILLVRGPAAGNFSDMSTFVNLTDLELIGGNLTSLNLNGLNNLTHLNCSNNQLTSLNLSSQTNLVNLWINQNQFTNIDLSGLPLLNQLFCQSNLLTNLDLSNNNNLNVLDFSNNALNSINLSNLNNLEYLYANGNNINSINTTANPLLRELQIENTNINSINLSNNPLLSTFYFRNTPIQSMDLSSFDKLTQVAFGGNALIDLNLKNGKNELIYYLESPNLQFICVDDSQINNLQSLINLTAVVSSYCTFVPGGLYNNVVGTVKWDESNDGCDTSDTNFPYNVKMKLSDGTIESATFLNANGNYTLYAETGTYMLVPEMENPEYFNISPTNATINFPSLDNSVSEQNFCITANGVHQDLEIILVPTSSARPGFDEHYKIVYKNKGNQILSGQVNLTFDDAHIDFVSASPNIDSQSLDNLYWTFNNLAPFETRSIAVVLNLNSPTENPPLNAGNILHFTAQSNFSVGESTPYDNIFELNQTVVNSHDPNDKTCLQGNTIVATEIGKYVHYNINFENIGSSEAINIVVKDTINTQMFDINSLQLLYASHPVETKIRDNIVEFIFRGIHLPPSNGGPIGGHGNVLFKIKTLPTLQVGDEIANTANIFFDYNHPIETNEARSAYANLSQSVFVKDESISLLPNPAKDKITVSALYALKSIEIYDAQGRLLQTIIDHNKTKNIDLSSYVRGVYLVKINTQKGSAVQKLIKE